MARAVGIQRAGRASRAAGDATCATHLPSPQAQLPPQSTGPGRHSMVQAAPAQSGAASRVTHALA